ncbi:MAG: spore germination protein [Clostridia bacterium]|nr:spore germination protein [Clostridia bacterium]
MEVQSEVEKKIYGLFCENSDLECRKILVAEKTVYLFFISCLVDKELIVNGVTNALFERQKSIEKDIISSIEESVVSLAKVQKVFDDQEITKAILGGALLLAVDGEKSYLTLQANGESKRSITEPPNESALRGPREGFIENIEINLGLLRRRLKTTTLTVKRKEIGRRTHTKLALVYLCDVADPKIVRQLEQRLDNFDIDGVMDSYYIEEILSPKGDKFFKKIGSTEKPDVVAAKILEGRVAIFVDGSPTILTVPYMYFEDMQSPGDYYDIPLRTTFVRFLRLFGMILSLMLPGLYVALESYQYRVLPINFLINLLNAVEGISFPPMLEVLFVIFLFEILAEASVRMPKPLGTALSIIGAVILGDTAVKAGIISSPSIVVVAISGITLYIIPNQSSQASLLRTLFTIVGGIAGFYGLFVGFFMVFSYLASMENYGAPYFAPFAPYIATDQKDGFTKKPIKAMIYRPKSYKTMNSVRQQPFDKTYKTKVQNKSLVARKMSVKQVNSEKNKEKQVKKIKSQEGK